MSLKHAFLAGLVAAGALTSSGCQPTPAPPTALPTSMPTVAAVVAPTMVEPTAIPLIGQPAVCWYGSVHALPEGGQYDDYLALQPEDAGEIGITGETEEVEAAIVALRDIEPPGNLAHFRGTVFCDVPDVGGCQLVVASLVTDDVAMAAAFEPVEGWDGTVTSWPEDEPGVGGDAYLTLAGDFPIRFGISSADDTLAEQLAGLLDTGIPVRISGELSCGPTALGAHIDVTRIE